MDIANCNTSMFDLKVFCGSSNPQLGKDVAKWIGKDLGAISIKRFADGEVGVRVLESVRGCDCFFIQSTCTPVNDHLMEMFLVTDALRRASAKRITVVIPYYGYARQDRKTEPRVPISAALTAKLIETSGADRVVSIDLHSGQIQGFFCIPVDNLYAQQVMCREQREFFRSLGKVTVVSPDAGGVERADVFRGFLAKMRGGELAGMAVMNKRRKTANEVQSMELVGDVDGSDCIIVDDMIDTAGTLVAAADVLKENGAKRIFACATHALLNDPAVERIANSQLERVFITDTVPLPEEKRHEKFTVISVAKLIAQAIRHVHDEQSITTLFNGGAK